MCGEQGSDPSRLRLAGGKTREISYLSSVQSVREGA